MLRAKAAVGLAAVAVLGSGALVVTHDAPSCRTQAHPAVVDLDNRRHIHVLDHAWDTIDKGHPQVLHLDREGADENRQQSLRGIPTKPKHDRDEYPPAVSREGGRGAHVRYVGSRENRSAGSVMGRQLRRFCNGQAFQYEQENR